MRLENKVLLDMAMSPLARATADDIDFEPKPDNHTLELKLAAKSAPLGCW